MVCDLERASGESRGPTGAGDSLVDHAVADDHAPSSEPEAKSGVAPVECHPSQGLLVVPGQFRDDRMSQDQQKTGLALLILRMGSAIKMGFIFGRLTHRRTL